MEQTVMPMTLEWEDPGVDSKRDGLGEDARHGST
jgi:hypothetical protein